MQVVGPIQRDDTTAFFKFSYFAKRAKERALEQPDNAARCVDCVVYTLRVHNGCVRATIADRSGRIQGCSTDRWRSQVKVHWVEFTFGASPRETGVHQGLPAVQYNQGCTFGMYNLCLPLSASHGWMRSAE